MFSWPNLHKAVIWAASCSIAYVASLVIYRLSLHPLAKFPGPKIAAISFAYEFYWDVVQPGQLTHHLWSLHEKYGPVVRITPDEVHILDSSFFDELYARSGNLRRHKSPRFSGRFGNAQESFSSSDHDLHKLRRGAINPFFSSTKVINLQPVIRKKLTKLVQVLIRNHEMQEIVPMNLAYMALIGDITTEYAFARSYDQLDSPGFEGTYDECLKALFTQGNANIHFPFLPKIFQSLPRWITAAVNPVVLPVVDFYVDSEKAINQIRTGINEDHKLTENPTIFHQMLTTSLLPEHEKTDKRLADEAVEIVAAGINTTSWALTVGTFHILNNPDVLSRLRAELVQYWPDGLNLRNLEANKNQLNWRVLEPLLYLSGCVKESIRLSGGVVTRSPRILPDEDLKYRNHVIPRGNEISMTSWHVANDREIFSHPNEFRPERWIKLDSNSGKEIKNTELERYLVAFGKGPRQCAGINLAHAELYTILATIFRTFNMELYETDVSDATVKHAYLVPYPKFDTKGVKVEITGFVQG